MRACLLRLVFSALDNKPACKESDKMTLDFVLAGSNLLRAGDIFTAGTSRYENVRIKNSRRVSKLASFWHHHGFELAREALARNQCAASRHKGRSKVCAGMHPVRSGNLPTDDVEEPEAEGDAETWRQIMEGGEDVTMVMSDMIKIVSAMMYCVQ